MVEGYQCSDFRGATCQYDTWVSFLSVNYRNVNWIGTATQKIKDLKVGATYSFSVYANFDTRDTTCITTYSLGSTVMKKYSGSDKWALQGPYSVKATASSEDLVIKMECPANKNFGYTWSYFSDVSLVFESAAASNLTARAAVKPYAS